MIDTPEFELVVDGRPVPLGDDWVIRMTTGADQSIVFGAPELAKIIQLSMASTLLGLADSAASRVITDRLESESRDYYDRLGPWATGRAVCSALGVTFSILEKQRRGRRLLGVRFGPEGDVYYPVQQFVDGKVVGGLQDVLTALSAGYASAEAQAGWFSELAWEGRPETRWDVLTTDAKTVLGWAVDDAARANC